MKAREEEDDQLYQWLKSIFLDAEKGNLNPKITKEARSIGIDFDRVMAEELQSDDNTKEDSFEVLM